MVPPLITEDFYKILGMEQHFKLREITSSYRQLALKLHPDRNKTANATAAFQLV